MTSYNAPFEIHVHGEVLLRDDVDFKALQEATKPLWKYAGARSLTEGAQSLYEEEPGIRFEAADHKLQLCWTVRGDDDFRQVLDDLCMNINEISAAGAFFWSFSDEMVSAISSRSDDWRKMVRSALPTWVRMAC